MNRAIFAMMLIVLAYLTLDFTGAALRDSYRDGQTVAAAQQRDDRAGSLEEYRITRLEAQAEKASQERERIIWLLFANLIGVVFALLKDRITTSSKKHHDQS